MNLLTTILAEKVYHIGGMHGMIQNGGVAPLGDLLAVRFVPLKDKYVVIQVVSKGLDSKFGYLMQRQVKEKVKKKDPVKVTFKSEEEGLF